MDTVIYILSTVIVAFVIGLALGMMLQWSKESDRQHLDDGELYELSDKLQKHV
jgi:hypothetical protein